MQKRRVLIFDDEDRRRDEWKERLEEAAWFPDENFIVEAPSKSEFKQAVETLEERRGKARSNKLDTEPEPNECLFDEAAILFIDYDLFGLDHETGEEVAYLARCYSSCGLIVALNQFGSNPFDLTLEGHPESFADWNLGSEQIDNQGLWRQPWSPLEEGHELFRPWAWPLLPRALGDLEKRIQELSTEGALDEPILLKLGFDSDTMGLMSRSALAFLDVGEDLAPEEITFRKFVEGSDEGRRRKDQIPGHGIARVAAARLAKWLERMVLAGQEILVDAPHLVHQHPVLLDGDVERLEAWNGTVDFKKPSIKHDLLQQHRFPMHWLSRPAWFGEPVREVLWEGADLSEDLDGSDFVFCEDRSCFRSRESARAFRISLATAYSVRFVSEPAQAQVDYRPRVNFSR